MKTSSIIKLNASNDSNGNPRRVFVGIAPCGAISGAWDEGYAGGNAVPMRLRKMASNACTFDTTPSEYRELVRRFQ